MNSAIATREEGEARERTTLSPLACFSDTGAARPEPEPPDPFRTAFVRDRDRIVHCGAFRRLKDKTQVFVIDEGDFYRTASYAALIQAQLGAPVELVPGHFGQFEVRVGGRTVVSRKGGLIAKLTGRPFPDDEDVLSAVRAALGKA